MRSSPLRTAEGNCELRERTQNIECVFDPRQIVPTNAVPIDSDQLIAGLHDHDIVDHELLKRQRSCKPAAPDGRGRRDQQRETIERPLRPHLLNDPDRRVRHDDAQEQRVARVTEDQGDGPEPGEDQV